MLLRGINDDQAPELLRWCDRARLRAALHRADAAGRPARLEPRRRWSPPTRSSRRCEREFTLTPAERAAGERARRAVRPSTAARHTVGVIASVTRPFCGDCDRVRLTADGQVRNCLFAREESDLRGALRAGADDEEIAERWVRPRCSASAPGHGIDDVDVPAAEPPDVRHRRLSGSVAIGG